MGIQVIRKTLRRTTNGVNVHTVSSSTYDPSQTCSAKREVLEERICDRGLIARSFKILKFTFKLGIFNFFKP